MSENRFGEAVGLLMEAAERFQAIGIAPETMKRIDDFIATVHPAECVELPDETPRPEGKAWENCTRCGAAILSVHPESKPQKERP